MSDATTDYDSAADLWGRPPQPEVVCWSCAELAEPYQNGQCWLCFAVHRAMAAEWRRLTTKE